MKKKLLLLLIAFIIPFLLTGCGSNNNSPENVSKAMLNKLISGDFKGTKDIFYHKDAYFDDDVFAKLAEDKGLLLKGVKSYKVKEVSDEVVQDKKTIVKVTYELDGKGTFTFVTIKENDKWYIYDESFYNGNINIAVPKGASVTFNNERLKEKEVKKQNVVVKHKEISYGTTIEDVDLDVYTIKKALKGEYPITVTLKDKELKDKIGTYSNYKISDNGNYSYKLSYEKKVPTITYTINIPSTNKDAVSYVNNFYKEIYKAANDNKKFEDVSKYFDSKSKNIISMTASYNNLLRRSNYSYISNYKADFELDKLYDYDKYVGITGKVNYSYDSKLGEKTTNRKDSKNVIIILKKTDKDYIIYNGNSFLPN